MSSLNAVNDLPITPVSATFSDHPGSGPGSGSGSGSGPSTLSHSHSSHSLSHHLSAPGSGLHSHSHSQSHSGPLAHSLSGPGSGSHVGSNMTSGAAGLGMTDDGYFSQFDDLTSFGPIPSEYTSAFGLGAGGQWGAYSPGSSFD